MRAKLILVASFVVVATVLTGVAAAGSRPVRVVLETPSIDRPVRVVLETPSIDLYHSAPVQVSGVTSSSAQVRPIGAIDRKGFAYEWKPYRWQALRVSHGTWHGLLPAPPLFGIYRLQLRLDRGRTVLTSPRWLLRVVPRGTMKRRSFSTAFAAVRGYVAHLPGDEVLVASRRWPLSSFDHRDARLNQQFVIAYGPRGDTQPSSRLGRFVSAVRNGYHGRWRILGATTQPYG